MSISFSGNLWGSSSVPMMRSGPAPTLAATAAFGRMSSQLSASSLTLTPVFSENALVCSANLSNSAWMNCFQRSTRMEAFASGVLVHSAARTGTMPGPASRAAPPRPALSTLRLSKLLIVLSLRFYIYIGRLLLGSSSASLHAFARRLVEQMNHGRIGLQLHLVTRIELMTFAEDRDDLLTTELRKHLRF